MVPVRMAVHRHAKRDEDGRHDVASLPPRELVIDHMSPIRIQVPKVDLSLRFGCSPGGPDLEDGLRWSAEHGFRCVVFTTDAEPNALSEWPEDRVQRVRRVCDDAGLRLVVHTLSAVNVAEFVPYMADAVDAYLAANIDLAARIGAEVIVHAGLHFSERVELRMRVSLEHLGRAAAHAEEVGVVLLLENMNFEPAHAEVHYLGHSVEELRYYLEAISSPAVKWAFSANHAELVPGGFGGFLDALGVDRIGIVMVADCRGEFEEHLLPGQGTLDFARLFGRLEREGYSGPYLLTFGPRDQLLAGREYILDRMKAAGAIRT